MLAKTPRRADGKYRALASLLIAGKPMGPFEYNGTRGDDPNDLVTHEHRRDLRALRTLCAWLGHDDSKSLNTLDMLAEENGTPFIKHYLIDFGASLGSASFMANSPRDGNVYLFDWKSSAAQFFTLGLYAPSGSMRNIRSCRRPAVSNTRSSTRRAGWAIIPTGVPQRESRGPAVGRAQDRGVHGEEIRAMVSTGQYTDPAAEEWVARCLIERRKKIVDAFLTGTAGLDRFEVRGNRAGMDRAGRESAAPVQRAVGGLRQPDRPAAHAAGRDFSASAGAGGAGGLPGGGADRRPRTGDFGLRPDPSPAKSSWSAWSGNSPRNGKKRRLPCG